MQAYTNFEKVFISGLLASKLAEAPFSLSREKERERVLAPEESNKTIQLVLKVGQTEILTKMSGKKYKFTLEKIKENLLLLNVIDISKGSGHVLVQKREIITPEDTNTIILNLK